MCLAFLLLAKDETGDLESPDLEMENLSGCQAGPTSASDSQSACSPGCSSMRRGRPRTGGGLSGHCGLLVLLLGLLVRCLDQATHTLPHASTACQRSSWQPLPPDEKPRNDQILSHLCVLDSDTNAFSCSCHKNGCSCRIQTGLDCTSRLLPSPCKQIRDVKSPFFPRSWMPSGLTHSQTLKDRATQLIIKYKSGALVMQCMKKGKKLSFRT